MRWSDTLMRSLGERSAVLRTPHGHVEVASEGSGTPVVVLHGGPGGFDQGLAWCRHLSDRGCLVLAPSRPGYLRTPLQSGRSPEDQADLYAAMLDALGIERAAILAFSSGGPSAVHFAARHPARTRALLLDAAVLGASTPPINRMQRAVIESRWVVWLSYQLATRWPSLTVRVAVGGASRGLSRSAKRSATRWITSDTARLRALQEQLASIAPRQHRAAGWRNDETNERDLAPLPFASVSAPTLIAQGANDAIVPVDHATNAAKRIENAELVLVEEGHHLLSMSRDYRRVASRQLELAQS